jgi:hypothetical protein
LGATWAGAVTASDMTATAASAAICAPRAIARRPRAPHNMKTVAPRPARVEPFYRLLTLILLQLRHTRLAILTLI